MKHMIVLAFVTVLVACGSRETGAPEAHDDPAHGALEVVKGPHNGRMLVDGPLAIELAIFETGVPPEFHAWPTFEGKPVPLDQVTLAVDLTRLGGRHDRFTFAPQAEYLRADGVVREPHSFVVNVEAQYNGKTSRWTYESFEGRTTIAANIAAAAGVRTEKAGPAMLEETVSLYGRIVPNPAHQRDVSARFPGLIQSVHKNLGDRVSAGDTLAQIESNESLQTYALKSPIAGTITARVANPGEQSAGGALFTVTDTSQVVAELSVFPRDRARIRPGARVRVKVPDSDRLVEGRIERVGLIAGADQSVIARAQLENRDAALVTGSFVTAEVAVSEKQVPLAVKTIGLQPFRDFTVVFERIGETYEVRMLELGEQRGEWVEILGGLDPGAEYVTENSYVIKADVEKSGASHDH
ncbi:MAG TPA: efflux RND transporter periplasmic adaptor subunit [Steroidobacteraceae bacterium]|nr:efflux RND transporter periplasmic adaptor subunit [Steroidobacteraceae bacterium]